MVMSIESAVEFMKSWAEDQRKRGKDDREWFLASEWYALAAETILSELSRLQVKVICLQNQTPAERWLNDH